MSEKVYALTEETVARALHDSEMAPFPMPLKLNYDDLTEEGRQAYLERSRMILSTLPTVERSGVPSVEICRVIAQDLQRISEKIGTEAHPEPFKDETEAMVWYEKVKGAEVEAHAKVIHAHLSRPDATEVHHG